MILLLILTVRNGLRILKNWIQSSIYIGTFLMVMNTDLLEIVCGVFE
ncbi:MAG: hypothetical protein MjAS7_2354 [Metallosphaera javensis (ex Sakai et al. 2022)]|nr:MAG: hypothetical protein MjAS7_2354 [Metallosphaera javensis (ex Sakai et al. 2022)]